MIADEIHGFATFLVDRSQHPDGLGPAGCVALAQRLREVARRIDVLEGRPIPVRHRAPVIVASNDDGPEAA